MLYLICFSWGGKLMFGFGVVLRVIVNCECSVSRRLGQRLFAFVLLVVIVDCFYLLGLSKVVKKVSSLFCASWCCLT